MDDDLFETMRDTRRALLEHQYAHWIKTYAANSPIEFYDTVTIDDYFTVTIGEWGGYLIQIMPMALNDRLVMTPQSCPNVYDFGWCFDRGPAALLAALVWNPETQGEPVGFKKRVGNLREPGERAVTDPRALALFDAAMKVLDAATTRSAGPAPA